MPPQVLLGAAALLYFRVTALVSQGLCPHATVLFVHALNVPSTELAPAGVGLWIRRGLSREGEQTASGLGLKTDRGLALDPTTATCPRLPPHMQPQSAPMGMAAQCVPDAAEDCPGMLTLPSSPFRWQPCL